MFSRLLFQFGTWTDLSFDLLFDLELKSGRMNQHAGVLYTDRTYRFKILLIQDNVDIRLTRFAEKRIIPGYI